MKTVIIILSVLVILALFLFFTPAGQKIIKKIKGEEIDTSTELDTDAPIPSDTSKPKPFVGGNPEKLLRKKILEVYNKVTIMKTPYNGIKIEDVQLTAMKYGRTYKEQLSNDVIDLISKNTHPFGNIDNTPIPENILANYRTKPRPVLTCRPGMNVGDLILKGIYKDFPSNTACKENVVITSIFKPVPFTSDKFILN